MKLVTEWIENEINVTFSQMRNAEELVKQLREKYSGWRYVQSEEYGNIPAYFRKMLGTGKSYQMERITKDVNAHFVKLQYKVEERIGKINEILHLGGEDYFFKGETGEVGVMVILAGGWNIQRLHTRWVFDRKKKK